MAKTPRLSGTRSGLRGEQADGDDEVTVLLAYQLKLGSVVLSAGAGDACGISAGEFRYIRSEVAALESNLRGGAADADG